MKGLLAHPSDSRFWWQGRPGGRHHPLLTGQIVQHGVRGVRHRQPCADFLVCVVVVLLALLLRGCRWQRLGASEAPNGAVMASVAAVAVSCATAQLQLRGYVAGGWEVAGAFRRVGRCEGYGPSLAASHPLAVEGVR